ncbi:CHAT domain-containing protein [Crucibulum laeve]|uniref:CHAT domain-containing protein n=1 Tax=Crucibulum laeve TaxID=68775 RepID=A0A5C3MES4_9AGAR|nr:CHAT domain-containing protein [Crucibulum laeve]
MIRFSSKISSLAVLDQAITAFEHFVEVNDIPGLNNNLGLIYCQRVANTADSSDIKKSIALLKRGTNNTQENDPELPTYLSNLAYSLRRSFEKDSDITTLEEALVVMEKAILLTSDENQNKPFYLNDLANLLHTHFERLGHLKDLEDAILLQRKAIKLVPNNDKNVPMYCTNLGNFLLTKFENGDSHDVLNEAFLYHTKAVDLTSYDDDDKFPMRLNNLANFYLSHSEHDTTLSSATKAIDILKRAMQILPESHENVPKIWNNLGIALLKHAQKSQNSMTISQAIEFQEKAIAHTPENHIDFPLYQHSLGESLSAQFDQTENIEDLNKAISAWSKATENISLQNAHDFNLIGNLYHKRYELTGEVQNLEDAISAQQKAVNLTSEDNINLPMYLNNFGIPLVERFQHNGSLDDLNNAITVQQKAVNLCKEGHIDASMYLNNLGNSFLSLFEYNGDIYDLNEAISLQQKALDFISSEDTNIAMYMCSLGNSFLRRFELSGHLNDIDEAISLQRTAAEKAPNSLLKASYSNNLGNALVARFKRTRNLEDVDEAITMHQQAIDLVDETNIALPIYLNNLGNAFADHFEHSGNITSLEEAISLQRKAINIIPAGHVNSPKLLNNLGNSLLRAFEKSENMHEIDEAIQAQQKAISLTPQGHANIATYLNSLGNCFFSRYEIDEDIDDLRNAIIAQREAISLTDDSHADLPMYLNNLGNSLLNLFEAEENQADFEECLSAHNKTLDLTPENHADISMYHNSLGDAYLSHFERSDDDTSMKMAAMHFKLATKSYTGPPSKQLYAAQRWASVCVLSDPTQATEAYNSALMLLPRVAWIGDSISNRYTQLESMSDLGSEAAAAAIQMGNFEKSIEWLEQGRAIIWNQLNGLRTPFDKLKESRPEIYQELIQVSTALEEASTHGRSLDSNSEGNNQKVALHAEAKMHHRLAEQWDKLLATVQNIPEFENFLKPLQFSQICERLPKSGAVVIINIFPRRCDALVLQYGTENVIHIELDQFSYEDAQYLQNLLSKSLSSANLKNRNTRDIRAGHPATMLPKLQYILSELWKKIAVPIINRLGYLPSSDPPRVWWCVTGPLSFLPLHAAGLYESKNKPTGSVLSDYVISSYIPTISTILRMNPDDNISKKEFHGILALGVSQPLGSKLPVIKNVIHEVNGIQKLFKDVGLKVSCLEEDNATIADALKNMETHSWVHIACHGLQNAEEPMRSAFYLYDNCLELEEIIKKSLPYADFAFLSACETGTGDENLAEEAVHLAAGMLAAGYDSIIATMWPIDDEDAPAVAQDVYAQLLQKEREYPDSSNAAKALHVASKNLRERKGINEASFLSWVPFIHIGL